MKNADLNLSCGELATFEIGVATELRKRRYAPEFGSKEPEEMPVCTHSELCAGCTYSKHGFVCWHDENRCLRTDMMKIQNRRK